jgi:FMN-dependent NADH-azoreductase
MRFNRKHPVVKMSMLTNEVNKMAVWQAPVMPTLLHLDSSIDDVASVSRALTARFAAAWTASGPGHLVVRRDLHAVPVPHLASPASHWAPHLRGGIEPPAAESELQARLIAEVDAADVVLIGAPMYNWSIPSTLKAWLDHLHVPGTTAAFDTDTVPFRGKPVVVVSSRGDRYGPGTPNPDADHEIPALRQALAVALGMDVTFVVRELTLATAIPAMAALVPAAEESQRAAEAQLDELVARLA